MTSTSGANKLFQICITYAYAKSSHGHNYDCFFMDLANLHDFVLSLFSHGGLQLSVGCDAVQNCQFGHLTLFGLSNKNLIGYLCHQSTNNNLDFECMHRNIIKNLHHWFFFLVVTNFTNLEEQNMHIYIWHDIRRDTKTKCK